jgi:hypothetical protein
MKVDWLWLLIGIAFALFVFPMLSAWWSSRSAKSD